LLLNPTHEPIEVTGQKEPQTDLEERDILQLVHEPLGLIVSAHVERDNETILTFLQNLPPPDSRRILSKPSWPRSRHHSPARVCSFGLGRPSFVLSHQSRDLRRRRSSPRHRATHQSALPFAMPLRPAAGTVHRTLRPPAPHPMTKRSTGAPREARPQQGPQAPPRPSPATHAEATSP
jgi:hypothetical protein